MTLTVVQAPEVECELVSLRLDNQLVGVPVCLVQDILGPQTITKVPRATPEIAGVLNLRGRIVTSVCLRTRLGLPAAEERSAQMSVVVEHQGELYSLLIDQVGEVLHAPADRFETDMSALSPAWREVSSGVFRLDQQLLVVLDVGRILSFPGAESTR